MPSKRLDEWLAERCMAAKVLDINTCEYKWWKGGKACWGEWVREVALISETSNRPRRRQPPTYSLQCLSYSLILALIWQISDMNFSLPGWMIQIITLMSVICRTWSNVLAWNAPFTLSGIKLFERGFARVCPPPLKFSYVARPSSF